MLYLIKEVPPPTDGRQYLAYNKDSKEYQVLNCPPNHSPGRWQKIKGKWYGNFVAFMPTHWCKIPKHKVQKDKSTLENREGL